MGRVIDGTEAFALRRLVADGRRSINDLPTDGVDNVESIQPRRTDASRDSNDVGNDNSGAILKLRGME
jgi:hypothetical protein